MKIVPLGRWRSPHVIPPGRCLSIAIIALSGLCFAGEGHATEQQRKIENASAQQHASPASPNIPRIESKILQTPVEDRGCADHKDNRQSELCAQWQAVDAARDSVHYAFLSAIISGFGTLLLVWTLYDTRKNTTRELRAYVSVGEGTLRSAIQPNGDRAMEYQFTIKNGGNTPAYDCRHAGNIVVMASDYAEEYFTKGWKKAPRIGAPLCYVIHGNEFSHASIASHVPVTKKDLDDLTSGRAQLYAFGWIEYRDTFQRKRRTRFCRSVDATAFNASEALARKSPGTRADMQWNVEPFHNDAT